MDNGNVEQDPVTWSEDGRLIPLTEAEKERLAESATTSGPRFPEEVPHFQDLGRPRRHRILHAIDWTWFEWMLDPSWGLVALFVVGSIIVGLIKFLIEIL